jgi:hypothetical protein
MSHYRSSHNLRYDTVRVITCAVDRALLNKHSAIIIITIITFFVRVLWQKVETMRYF